MGGVWKSSLLGRLYACLAALWPDSLLCRISNAWTRCVAGSRLLSPIRRWNERGAERSQAGALARLVTRWTEWLRAAAHGSLIGRIWGWLYRVLAGSRLLGWFFRGGITGLFLWALALYVPLDWFFRDVQPIGFLGSIWDELLLIAAVAWVVWMRVDRKVALLARATPLHGPVLAFILLAVIQMFLVSPYFSIAVSGMRATVQYMLWFFVIVSLLRTDRDFLSVYVTMAVVGAVIALHGIYQYIVAVPMPSEWMSSSEQSVRTRVFSIFGSPNIMGDFMAMMAPLAAGLFFYWKDWRLKLLCAGAVGVMCLSCLFTMSRGAWIALVVAAVIFVALIDKRLLVLALVLGVCALFVPFVWSRVSYLFSKEFWFLSTNGGRVSRWQIGISYLYRTNPIFGMGLGMYGGAVAMQHQRLHWIWYTYLDNYYLRIFVEMGWVGIVGFALLLLSVLCVGFRVCTRCRAIKGEKALAAGLLSGLTGVMAHLTFENIFEEPYMLAVFWILTGLMVWFGFLRTTRRTDA